MRGFGRSVNPFTGEEDNNLGLDIATDEGADVIALYDGTIQRAGYMQSLGQTVAIDHDSRGTYRTVYAHLAQTQVQAGDKVCAGQVIGKAGSTGLAVGERALLTFQLRYNNTPQDPLPWLKPQ